MATFSADERTVVRQHVEDNQKIYPPHLLCLIEEPVENKRMPGPKSREILNPFAVCGDWPENVLALPLQRGDVTDVALKEFANWRSHLQVRQIVFSLAGKQFFGLAATAVYRKHTNVIVISI